MFHFPKNFSPSLVACEKRILNKNTIFWVHRQSEYLNIILRAQELANDKKYRQKKLYEKKTVLWWIKHAKKITKISNYAENVWVNSNDIVAKMKWTKTRIIVTHSIFSLLSIHSHFLSRHYTVVFMWDLFIKFILPEWNLLIFFRVWK